MCSSGPQFLVLKNALTMHSQTQNSLHLSHLRPCSQCGLHPNSSATKLHYRPGPTARSRSYWVPIFLQSCPGCCMSWLPSGMSPGSLLCLQPPDSPLPPPHIYQSTLIFMWTPAHPMPASVTVLVTLNGSISSDWLGYPWQTDLLCSWKHRDVTCAWTMHSPGFSAWRDSLSSCLTSWEVTSNLP